MMNFWNKAGNFISNAILRDKTKDEKYQSLCKKMYVIESGIKSLKSILKGYNTYLEPFCKYLITLNESINKIYKNSPLKIEVNEIIKTHLSILNEFQTLEKIIAKLYSKTSEWDAIFEKAKESIRIRDEKRRTYEHYEQKLSKIEENQNKKKEKDYIIRNRDKYTTASKEYFDASEKSFEIIKNTIKLSWELTNPVFGELIINEKNTFGNITSHLTYFQNINYILDEIMDKEFNPELTKSYSIYNPKQYINSKFLKKKENEHVFIRNTNTFGNVPFEREQKFNNIKDKLLNDEEE